MLIMNWSGGRRICNSSEVAGLRPPQIVQCTWAPNQSSKGYHSPTLKTNLFSPDSYTVSSVSSLSDPKLVNPNMAMINLLSCDSSIIIGRNIFAALDTQAIGVNLLHLSLLKSLDPDEYDRLNISPTESKLMGFNEFLVNKPLGQVTLTVQIGKFSLLADFLIVEHSHFLVILGSDVLQAANIRLSLPVGPPASDSNQALHKTDASIHHCGQLSHSHVPNVDTTETPDQTSERNEILEEVYELARLNNDLVLESDTIDHPLALDVRCSLDPTKVAPYVPQFHLPQKHMEAVDVHLKWAMENDKIEENPDPYPASNISLFVVEDFHSDGTFKKYRPVADMTPVNPLLVNDKHPLPNLRKVFMSLSGAKLFTEIDLSSAFYQLRMHPDFRSLLAFRWRGKNFRFKCAPHGLKFLSQLFQTMMEDIFKDLQYVIVYVDNIWIYSRDLDYKTHQKMVLEVLKRLNKYKIRINIKKLVLARQSFIGLGYKFSAEGRSADPAKIDAIQAWPEPKSKAALQSFLGYAGFLRDFIRHYADITFPLVQLTHKDIKWNWSENKVAKAAFELLKRAIVNLPTICFPNFDASFAICCDASDFAIGGVLFQPKDDIDMPSPTNIVAFFSQTLQIYERSYTTFKKELLALVRSIEKFRDYIWGVHFTVYTDHRALQFAFSSKNHQNNRTLLNWLHSVLSFDFSIRHLPGFKNSFADALSRMYPALWGIPASEKFYVATDRDFTGKTPMHIVSVLAESYKVPENPNATVKEAHEFGHGGTKAVISLLHSLGFKWKDMANDVSRIVQECSVCQRWNVMSKLFDSLKSTESLKPWQKVQCDLILQFQNSPSGPMGYKYILVLVDVLTNFTIARPLVTKEAKEIFDHWLQIFSDLGAPDEIIIDAEINFSSSLLERLCEVLKVKHIVLTPYNHRANAHVERTNGLLGSLIRKSMEQLNINEWHLLIYSAQLQLNLRIQGFLQLSAFQLFTGRLGKYPFINEADSASSEPIAIKNVTESDLLSWAKHILNISQELFPALSPIISAKNRMSARKFKLSHPYDSNGPLEKGTMVMLKDVNRASKAHPPYVGPFTITDYTEHGTYILADKIGGHFIRDVPRDQLKKLLYYQPKNIPANQRDAYVDYIVAHRVIQERPEYCVRFSGFGLESDQWLDVSLIDLDIVHEYLKSVQRLPTTRKKTPSVTNKNSKANSSTSNINKEKKNTPAKVSLKNSK